MNRPYYSEYIRHAMRFYARSVINSRQAQPFFKSDVDKKNWQSCHNALKDYSDSDKDILISVYAGFDTLPDEVYQTAEKHKINQNIIWDMMKEFERKCAKKRGLL